MKGDFSSYGVLILDPKNFMIRPTDESFFFRNGSILYIPSFSYKDFFKKTASMYD